MPNTHHPKYVGAGKTRSRASLHDALSPMHPLDQRVAPFVQFLQTLYLGARASCNEARTSPFLPLNTLFEKTTRCTGLIL